MPEGLVKPEPPPAPPRAVHGDPADKETIQLLTDALREVQLALADAIVARDAAYLHNKALQMRIRDLETQRARR